MYTFCSFYQEINISPINRGYFKELIDKIPTCLESLNCEIIKSRSALANAILASSKKLLDCITSSVVLVLPESYSKVMPSLAISAAFN